MLRSFGVRPENILTDGGVGFAVAIGILHDGKVGFGIRALYGFQPGNGPFVAVLPKLEIRAGIAQVDEVPHGDVLDEDQQQRVALVARGAEDLLAVISPEIAPGLLDAAATIASSSREMVAMFSL